MFAKNLKYYRLKKGITKAALASQIGVTSMSITHYENGDRYPDMNTIEALANALGIKAFNFIESRNQNLVFDHGKFRKSSRLNKSRQEYIREAVEDYFSRFYDAVEMVGGDPLPEAPEVNAIQLSDNTEINGQLMRQYLGIAESGPVGNLIEIVENRGILIYLLDIDDDLFAGLNGTVNGRPYIVVNENMTPERIRTTIGHEIAHFAFCWPENINEKDVEKEATAISGVFLMPRVDLVRELGVFRRAITNDMYMVCKEYGIALSMLVVRARKCNIIRDSVYKEFFIQLNKNKAKKEEKSLAPKEETHLFDQLVYRAVTEESISIQKGAELLRKPYAVVEENCAFTEV